MIFERQRLLLALLAANGGGLEKLDFQKILFLYTQTCEQEPSYEFVPISTCYWARHNSGTMWHRTLG